jgi:cold shock CspA family protein
VAASTSICLIYRDEGQHIEYEIEENRGKSSAVNLKVK